MCYLDLSSRVNKDGTMVRGLNPYRILLFGCYFRETTSLLMLTNV